MFVFVSQVRTQQGNILDLQIHDVSSLQESIDKKVSEKRDVLKYYYSEIILLRFQKRRAFVASLLGRRLEASIC